MPARSVDGASASQALLGLGQRVQGRAREEPVQQQELGHPLRHDVAAVGPQERLVGAAGPQHGAPLLRPGLVESAYGLDRQQPGGHVDPLEAAAEHEEPPAVVAAHGGLGQPGQHRGPLPDEAEEHGRPEALGGHRRDGRECQVTLRHSQISLEIVSRAPRAFSRAAASAPAMELGLSASKASSSSTSPVASRASCGAGRAEDGQQRPAGRVLVDPRVLEDAGRGTRRGCGRCRRPARRTGRSRTATRRSG